MFFHVEELARHTMILLQSQFQKPLVFLMKNMKKDIRFLRPIINLENLMMEDKK